MELGLPRRRSGDGAGRPSGSRATGLAVAAGACLVTCLAAGGAGAAGFGNDGAGLGPRIVNGLTTHDFPTTGALLYSQGGDITENNAQTWCSGTLIGCQTFLTAAHCVDGDATASHYWVYLQHAGISVVSSLSKHPAYLDTTFPVADLAILKLASPVTGIAPTTFNTLINPADVGFGLTGVIAGFGQTQGGANDYGIKRFGAVATASCTGTPSGTTDTELVCWDFATPIGDPGDDSNTCNGDSGGPLFLDVGAGEVVAGVTSGGTSFPCTADDHSYDANVYNYQSYVQSELGADSTSVCGGLPAVGVGQVIVHGNSGTLDSGTSSATFTINVGASVSDLRFTLNGEDNGNFNVNFYVKEGLGAGPADFDCKADAGGNFGSCTFATPNGGDRSVFVERVAGSGEYQVTTTIFGGDLPVCGNDVTDFGEDCDGTDDSLCPTLCEPGCTCPDPQCGNDVIEAGEECDGVDPGSCPTGVCDLDCTCEDPACGNDILEDGEECDGTSDAACPGSCLPLGDPQECRCEGCGNGICDFEEDASDCPVDCGCAAPDACGQQAPGTCYCDEPCLGFLDCCPDACSACGVCPPDCGNGQLDFGEQCDDGNTVDGDCCSAVCQFESVGSPCADDSDICTDDECDGAGTCEHDFDVTNDVSCEAVTTTTTTLSGSAPCPDQPPDGCGDPGAGFLQITDRPNDESDRLRWKWVKGSLLLPVQLGDPTATTEYALCVYDEAGGVPALVIEATIPAAASGWDSNSKGYRYKDADRTHDGTTRAMLKSGDAGKSRLFFLANGENLPLPAPVDPEQFFNASPGVTVALLNGENECWSTDLLDLRRNTASQFRAKVQ